MKHASLLSILFAGLLLQSCYYDNKEELYQYIQQQECKVTAATYTSNIAPILTAHCIRCHRNGRQDGNVNLEGYNHVKPYADNGSLYGASSHQTGFSAMPSDSPKIPFCEIEQIRIWVENGALNN